MKDPRNDPTKTLRGHRGVALFVAGALVAGLAVTGLRAAFADGTATTPMRAQEAIAPTPARPLAPAALRHPATHVPPAPLPTTEPAPDPNALADGVYPTFIRRVDVADAAITVDVLQMFFGADAHQAAIEDGVPWRDVRYDPVYLRNENPLLRTLPVSEDVRIKLVGVCVIPDRWVGLTKLRAAITPFTEGFYYDVAVTDGSVVHIRQLVAVAGC